MRSSSHPFTSGTKPKYQKNQVLFDGKDGDSAVITFFKGYYAVRGQGAGGGGGNNNYWHNGVGGGSGAGFEGFLYFDQNIKDVLVGTGSGGANSTAGTNTYINGILILSGGQGGLPGDGGQGGELIITADSEIVKIVKSVIQSNGNNGIGAPGNADGFSGGNSVLTNSGGGKNSNNATSPGAGGGGQWQWGGAGGTGMYGELKIVYVGRKLPTELT